jgi:hypothetical protein
MPYLSVIRDKHSIKNSTNENDPRDVHGTDAGELKTHHLKYVKTAI